MPSNLPMYGPLLPMIPAVAAVFNTVELMEYILLTLPTQNLLRAQRVSKAFKAAYAKSPQLNRSLFLSEDPAINNNVFYATSNNGELHVLHAAPRAGTYASVSKRYVFNPLFLDDKDAATNPKQAQASSTRGTMSIKTRATWRTRNELKDTSRWNMLITQPRVKVVKLTVANGKNDQTIFRKGNDSQIWNKQGVTFGDLLARIKTYEEAPHSSQREYFVTLSGGCFVSMEEMVKIEGGKGGNVAGYECGGTSKHGWDGT